MLICNNDTYSPETITFATVEAFLTYCRQALGEVPELTHQPLNGRWVDEDGEVVLVESFSSVNEALDAIEAEEQAEHDDALAERFAAEADEEAEVERHFAEEREDAERLTAALKGVGVDR